MINKIKCLRNIHYWLLTAWKIRKLNFVIIGAEKCGTTALFDCLKKHPYCIAPNRKETRMFSLRYEKHFNVFHSISYFNPKEIFFRSRKHFLFEATPENIYLEEVAERIYRYNPDMKLILLVREPVSRAISEYFFIRNLMAENIAIWEDPEGKYKDKLLDSDHYPLSWFVGEELKIMKETGSFSFSTVLFPDFVRRGLYCEQLKWYYQYFKPEQILILENKDLKYRPIETLKQVESFLNIPHCNWENEKKVNSNVGVYTHQISDECKQMLYEFYKPWNEKFFDMIGYRMDW
nr:sulfotransferase domain-containing protein [Parabacteroides goldsteinii]